jgi:glutamine synthetase
MGLVVGLEVEWYLLRVTQDQLTDENIGAPGVRGQPIRTCAPEPGYSYHSESNMDQMQPMLTALAEAYEKIDLPLRSIENEWGPGQVECTFAARDALTTADNLLLFRTATKQICRRKAHESPHFQMTP